MHTEKLPVTLSETEMAALAEEIGGFELEMAEFRAAKKAANKDLNDSIKNLQDKIDYKAKIATSGQEYRSVNVEWTFDFLEGVKRLIRLDTSKEVRNMRLSNEERQQSLFRNAFEAATETTPPIHETEVPVVETVSPSDDTKTEFSETVSELIDVFETAEGSAAITIGNEPEFDAVAERTTVEQAAAEEADASFINNRSKTRKKKTNRRMTEADEVETPEPSEEMQDIPF